MELAYKRLLYFDFVHSFYTSGKSNDFSLHQLSQTDGVIRRHQCIFHGRQGSNALLARLTATGDPFVTVTAGTELYFGLRMLTPLFPNYTAEKSGKGNIVCFTNVNLTTAAVGTAGTDADTPAHGLLNAIKAITASRIIYHVIESPESLKLRLTDLLGNEISVKQMAEKSNGKEVTFEVPAGRTGLFRITEDNGAPADPQYYFVHEETYGSNFFGVIQLITPTFSYNGKEFFRIAFASKEITWKYYFVSRSMSAADMITKLRVVDTGFESPDDLHTELTFTVPAEIPADDAVKSVFPSDDAVVAVKSVQPISCREKPRKKIELRETNQPRIENLSNPDPSKPDAIMIIQV